MANLTHVTTNIWRQAQAVSVMPGFVLPAHMTVIRLADNALWVHSPLELNASTRAELDALGQIEHIVAPNLFHHKWFGEMANLYPAAHKYAPSELARKLDSAVAFTALSADQQAFSPQLETHHVDGIPAVDEYVFYHTASRTLILTDLAFNMNTCQGVLTPLILKLAGTRRGLQCSRLTKSQVSDKQALERSLQTILALDFSRILLAHGDPVEGDAKQRLSAACQRLIS